MAADYVTDSLAVLHSSDAKSEIVKVLASTWPLSARQIFQKMKDAGGREISYQGVHKAVRQLEAAGVLKKEVKSYALDAGWLAQVKNFANLADAKYSGKTTASLEDVPMGGSASLSFDSYWNALYWILDQMSVLYKKRNLRNITAWFCFHQWPIIALSESDFTKLKFVVEQSDGYGYCLSGSRLDEIMTDFWKKVGTHNLIGVNEQRDCEALTAYEWLVQVYPSKKVIDGLDKLYAEKTELDAGAIDRLYKIIHYKDNKNSLVIIRNPEIADATREKILKHFNKKLKQGVPQSVV